MCRRLVLPSGMSHPDAAEAKGSSGAAAVTVCWDIHSSVISGTA